MSTFNQQITIGRLGKDVEIRTTRSGKTLASFVVATDDGFMNQQTGEWMPNVNWHRVVVYKEQLAARLAERIHKGDLIFVQGRWQHSSFTDANGEVRYSAEIVAQRVFLLNEVRSDSTAASPASTDVQSEAGTADQAYAEEQEMCAAEYDPEPSQTAGEFAFEHPSTLSDEERANLIDGEGNF